nr:uncharacterized protein LOC111512407 [Leptinotarsa decemlineata]
MEEAKGVYTVLKKCMEEKIRIKVWTRNQKTIRGYCLAYLVAYDKFWNMVLEDVTEYWNRPKKMKVPAFNTVHQSVEVRKIMRNHVRPPKVKVFPHESDKKLESCVRHVDQLMIRGEQVVFVSVMEESRENNLKKSDESNIRKNIEKGEKLDNPVDRKKLIHKDNKIRDTGIVVEISEEEVVELSDDDSSTSSKGNEKQKNS